MTPITEPLGGSGALEQGREKQKREKLGKRQNMALPVTRRRPEFHSAEPQASRFDFCSSILTAFLLIAKFDTNHPSTIAPKMALKTIVVDNGTGVSWSVHADVL